LSLIFKTGPQTEICLLLLWLSRCNFRLLNTLGFTNDNMLVEPHHGSVFVCLFQLGRRP
jgi:hypothetical protein